MRARNVALPSLFLASILLVVFLFFDSITTKQFAPSLVQSIRLKPEDLFSFASSKFFSLTSFLKGGSQDLAFYGALAVIGVLMVVLAIASGKSAPQDSTQAMLELLKQEKEKAENLAKLKSEFLNQVSHELRTPLAVIIGYIECMTDGLYGELNAKHQEILQSVSKQSTHLRNMIDQILIFSRLEASRQPVRISEFSLHKVINELKETYEFLCRQKRLGLTWDVPTRLGMLQSDPERLKEILNNLMGNAVKYTDQGMIRVRVREESATDRVIIDVEDTGMGIPQDSLATIFEPFIQVYKTSTANSRGGIGLGLSIVKKHVEQINGTITVESELGKGSSFRVTLPRTYDNSGSRLKKLLRFLRLARRTGTRPVMSATQLASSQE